MTDKIILAGLEFFGYHGAIEEEQSLGQRFEVDLELYTDLAQAGQSDELAHSVSYAEVFEVVNEIVIGPPYKLIEALAENISSAVLATFPRVQGLKVVVKKPGAPIKGKFKYMAVELIRKRK